MRALCSPRSNSTEGIPGVGGLTAGEIGFIGVIGLDNAGDAVGTEPQGEYEVSDEYMLPSGVYEDDMLGGVFGYSPGELAE